MAPCAGHNRLRHSDFDGRLDTTSLVHESFIRLASLRRLTVDDRAHFFAYAAWAMRSVVVNAAREAQSERRGGGNPPITLTTSAQLIPEPGAEIVAVHDALQELAAIDERLVRMVELRSCSRRGDAKGGTSALRAPCTIRSSSQRAEGESRDD